jgi:uncharacterized SAM-binding protein YcdF (DUF218 family)
MLDITQCKHTTLTGEWASLSWYIFDIVTNPAIVLPVLLTLIVLPWLMRSWRWKRQISSLGLLLLLGYGLVVSPAAIRLGNQWLLSLLPQNLEQSADAIVVLGRGPELRLDRTEAAAQLWQTGRAPLVFVSGSGDAPPMAQALTQAGLPDWAIKGESCSRTTEENAKFTAALLKPQGVQQIVLITDAPHMLRSVLTFRSFGFAVVPYPTSFPLQYQTRKQAFLILREYLGLVSYGLLGRFEPRPTPPVDSVAIGGPTFDYEGSSKFGRAGLSGSPMFAFSPAEFAVFDTGRSLN